MTTTSDAPPSGCVEIDLDAIERIAKAALKWSTGVWFVFDNPKAPHVPIEIRQGMPEGGPAAQMRTWQRLPCDECGGNHVNGADRWHIAEMTKATWRYYGCGRHAAADAEQSVRDEAAHIAAMDPTTTLALVARVRRLEAALREACDLAMVLGSADRDDDPESEFARIAGLRKLAP
jgi:hypothetical protein